mgnify:FL=1
MIPKGIFKGFYSTPRKSPHNPPFEANQLTHLAQKKFQVLLGLLHLSIGARADRYDLSELVRFSVEKIAGNSYSYAAMSVLIGRHGSE